MSLEGAFNPNYGDSMVLRSVRLDLKQTSFQSRALFGTPVHIYHARQCRAKVLGPQLLNSREDAPD